MGKWLYGSKGNPIVKIIEDNAFLNWKFLWKLEGDEIWYWDYKGEIFRWNRIVFDTSKNYNPKSIPCMPCGDISPNIPGSIWEITFSTKYRDINTIKRR